MVFLRITGFCRINQCAHADAVVGAYPQGTADVLHLRKIIHILWTVDKHITVILDIITVAVFGGTLSGTEDLLDIVVRIRQWVEVNKGVLQSGKCIAILSLILIDIVIVAIATAEDVLHATPVILHISMSRHQTRVIGQGLGVVADPV